MVGQSLLREGDTCVGRLGRRQDNRSQVPPEGAVANAKTPRQIGAYPLPTTMKCPFCNSKRIDVIDKPPHGVFRCTDCERLFDDEPDEGGDFSSRDASRRMEREEARAAKRRAQPVRKSPSRRFGG